jgi:peptide/nickel transport system permease protein
MTEPSSQTEKQIYQGRTWRSMKQNTLAMTGFAIIALLVFFSIFATVLAPFDPAEVRILDRLQAPGAQHWMGTDEFGRDILSRVLYGARVSLLISSMVVLSAGIVGSLMGLTAGYFLGATDFIVMRIVDGLMAFPALLLSLAIMAALGPNTVNLIIALAIVYVPGFARLTRNAVLSIRELEYVEASRAIGAGHLRIMFDHVLPNCLSPADRSGHGGLRLCHPLRSGPELSGIRRSIQGQLGCHSERRPRLGFQCALDQHLSGNRHLPFRAGRQSGRGRPARHSRSEERIEP